MAKIDVFAQHDKDFFRAAKDSVFGDGAFLCGREYTKLQEILNEEIRTNRHLIEWSRDAPPAIREIDVLSGRSYARRCQRYLKLTPMGEGRLQLVLTQRFGTMQTACT